MIKSILFYGNPSRIHSFLKIQLANPPKGYEFKLAKSTIKTDLLNFMFNSKKIKIIYKKSLKKILPSNWRYHFFNFLLDSKISSSQHLIFSEQILDINQPWIFEILDHPTCMTGNNYNLFLKNKKDIEKKLLSPFCKRIIIVNESSLKIMKEHFSSNVTKKCVLLRAGVIPETYKKKLNYKEIKIVFIGSLANPDDFYMKGGLEALESFKIISEKFLGVKLFFRNSVPNEIKKKYSNIPNLYFLDKALDLVQWKNLLKNADICLNPGHVYSLMATLESLNNCLSIIMLDSWGVKDYLKNDYNSILIKPSTNIKGYRNPAYPTNVRTKEFVSEIKAGDPRVIEDICSALSKLIKDKTLRQRLGSQGRKTILKKFNLNKRNKALKKIFDYALEN